MRSLTSRFIDFRTHATHQPNPPKENAHVVHAGVFVAPLPRPIERFSARYCFRAGFRAAHIQYRTRRGGSKLCESGFVIGCGTLEGDGLVRFEVNPHARNLSF